MVECRWTAELELSVTDTGRGIEAAIAPTIFDAFVKADPGLRSGLGLGLHISRGLAVLMGGSVAYRPASPRGSCFLVTLPLPATQPRATGPEVPADPLAILLVEDDPISREITAAWLTSQGHRVATVSDGNEAIALAQRQGFDLVLVDNDLGDSMSGEAVTLALRALPPPAANVSIIALTGAADDQAVIALRRAGVDDVILKPIPLTIDIADLVGAGRAASEMPDPDHRHPLRP